MRRRRVSQLVRRPPDRVGRHHAPRTFLAKFLGAVDLIFSMSFLLAFLYRKSCASDAPCTNDTHTERERRSSPRTRNIGPESAP